MSSEYIICLLFALF